MGKYLLGLDCGHTVTKAVLFDLTGKQLSVGKGKNLQISQHPGWQERTMHDAAEAALADLGVSLSQIESERFQYDFTSKTKRNFLSIVSWLIGTATLIYVAVNFSTR